MRQQRRITQSADVQHYGSRGRLMKTILDPGVAHSYRRAMGVGYSVIMLIVVMTCLLFPVSSAGLAQEKSSDNYDTRLERAIDFYSQKRYSEAAALLDTLSRSHADRKEAFLWLGQARAELKDWSAAREAYKRYSELAPQDVEGPRGVARTYEMESKRDLARFWYKKALDLEPANENIKEALNRLGDEPRSTAKPPASQEAAKSAEEVSVAKENEPQQKGFWREGIAGLLGARRIWWVRLIAIAIFGMMIIQGAFTSTKNFKEQFPRMPMVPIALSTTVGTAFWYILVWGLPSGFGWALMGGCVLVGAILSTGAMANR